MVDEFTGKAPIYYQIVQKICNQIVRGEINPGDKLPSVRELAVQYGVNPNTVKRVYMELDQMEISKVQRGQGTFVTENQKRLDELREQLKQDKIETFVSDMKEMGFDADEIAKGIQLYLNNAKKKEGKMDES
ncbi:putative HTH-type transcriptional regulator YhcF [Bacillus sp. J14TS2]|uniref:GntR family transcriptional regulator n=1 Tax=Bacillus sp. J14TS2 TaxID=2807188 RepID=UPI001B063C45|nr:GntR family transcriptional regulator [Bacillus sp. J14TS2]GIN72907.1 putative HTH-type transcriptional regulator YhcF [Bacillus sp. J14TS2]